MMAKTHAWIIDDDAIYTFTIKRLLEKNDLAHKIDVFNNGRDALEKLQLINCVKDYPDIILLDINMPVLDGWQFLDEFVHVADRTSITLYMVSSSIDPRDKEKSKLYKDINDFIIKPVSVKSLQNIMMVNSSENTD
ncbi:response regulator [Nonlabens antarcticus]|uniref:response regulator n=1 Tax=Nonlabens antarcticus TaxID=392714 RepID=UPI0018916A27|nr:response regulator [Nonlabens antarcticus]